MTAQVIQVSSETLTEFVQREGPVSARSVAYRFHLEMGEARRRLKLLRNRGVLRCRREILEQGAGLVWEAANGE